MAKDHDQARRPDSDNRERPKSPWTANIGANLMNGLVSQGKAESPGMEVPAPGKNGSDREKPDLSQTLVWLDIQVHKYFVDLDVQGKLDRKEVKCPRQS